MSGYRDEAKTRAKDEGGIYKRKYGRWAGKYFVETLTKTKRYYVYAMTRKEVVKCSLGRMAGTSPPRPRFLKTLPLNIGLTFVSPTYGYPCLHLYRYGYLSRAVHNCLHPFYHRPF
jgi:hypothetical protein